MNEKPGNWKGNVMKSQSSLHLFSLVLPLMAVLVSYLQSYAVPLILVTLCVASGFMAFRRKGSTGQTEMLISVFLMLLAAGSVVAYAAYNETVNLSFTGGIVSGGFNETQYATGAVKVVEASKTIEVWAGTSLKLSYSHDTGAIEASLAMDDGSPLQGRAIVFVSDGFAIGTGKTDSHGIAILKRPLANGTHELGAEFPGDPAGYLNPSSAEIELKIDADGEGNLTENGTARIVVDVIEFPASVNHSQEFLVKVVVRSLDGDSDNATLALVIPRQFELLAGPGNCSDCDHGIERKKTIPSLSKGETASASWKLRPDYCGNYTLEALADSENSDSRQEFVLNVICRDEYDWISYDPRTDIITVKGAGGRCSEEKPCGFIDIYNADRMNGWGQVSKLYDYYTFDAGLRIGDGESATWLFSRAEQFWLNEPILVMGKANLRFGEVKSGNLRIGAFIFTNVSVDNELAGRSAIEIMPGGGLQLYKSKYTVMIEEAENNLYAAVGSKLVMNDFTFQRKHKNLNTTLFTPPEAVIAEQNFVSGGIYEPLLEESGPRFLSGSQAVELVSCNGKRCR